jgi:hypothetical protein
MEKHYFISPSKINAKITDTVITSSFITIGDYTYQELSRPPKGRRIIKKFTKEDNSVRFNIYG